MTDHPDPLPLRAPAPTEEQCMTMIERMAEAAYNVRARAICGGLPSRWAARPVLFAEISPDAQAAEIGCMRAALEVAREPTPEMLATVAVATDPPPPSDYDLARKAVDLLPPSEHPDVPDILADLARDHRAMIDAILAEPKDPRP